MAAGRGSLAEKLQGGEYPHCDSGKPLRGGDQIRLDMLGIKSLEARLSSAGPDSFDKLLDLSFNNP